MLEAVGWSWLLKEIGPLAGVVALIISAYAATHARKAARAAERSATAAEESAKAVSEAVTLDRAQFRSRCIEALASALPDCEKVTVLIADLPEAFKPDWRAMLESAARQNPRTPPKRFDELLKSHQDRWAHAAGQIQPQSETK